jgi:hypothetical protein
MLGEDLERHPSDVTYLFESSLSFCRWSLVQYTRWQIHVGR